MKRIVKHIYLDDKIFSLEYKCYGKVVSLNAKDREIELNFEDLEVTMTKTYMVSDLGTSIFFFKCHVGTGTNIYHGKYRIYFHKYPRDRHSSNKKTTSTIRTKNPQADTKRISKIRPGWSRVPYVVGGTHFDDFHFHTIRRKRKN